MLDDAEVAFAFAVKELLVLVGREVAPRCVQRNLLFLRELGEGAALVIVARGRPWIDRAVAECAVGVGDDQ
jgi:hypothetical protein